jgi:hypothetical protein
MTNIIDLDHERANRKHDIDVMLGQRIRELCEEFWDEDHDHKAVIDALLRITAGILEDVEGMQPEMFIELAAGVARRFWPEGQHGLKWNRAALKRILVKR